MAKEIKYVARHLIPFTLTPGKPGDKAKGVAPIRPVIKNINPGDRIMLDPEADQTEFLLANSAIIKAEKDDEKAPVSLKPTKGKAKPVKAPEPDEDEGNGGGSTDEPQKAPADMTIPELKAALKAADISFEKDTKKADLVALLEGTGDDDKDLV